MKNTDHPKRISGLDEVCEVIKAHHNFLLCAHIRPEGDSIGSLLAVKYLLNHLGKKSTIVSEDHFPERLDLMPKDEWHTLAEIKASGKAPAFDACIVVDCPNPKRIGKVWELIGPQTTVINIDHHVSNSLFGNYNLVNDRAAACGEVIYDMFKKFDLPITREAALPLYVSISTDTGSFKYSNTTSKTHNVISELIEAGINVEQINEDLYEQCSHRRMSLLADLLDHIQVAMRGQVVWAVLKSRMLKKRRATFEDTEGFVDYLRSLKGVRIAFIVIENGKKTCQVSFRAKGSNDVNQVAEMLGGGGHRKASGCTIAGPAEKAAARILSVVRKYLRNPTYSKAQGY